MRNDSNMNGIACWHWALFALLQVFNLYQLLNHAMWRDELQVWSMARESSTMAELFHNMRYDGHPPLWYILIWGLTFFFASPVAMQFFHFACSLAAQILVMKRAPFPGNMKLAIVAGYYFSFEYCVISRAYVLGVLIIFILCAFHEWFTARPWAMGGILGLLANTSVYGAILSLAFTAYYLWLVLWRQTETEIAPDNSAVSVAAYLVVYGVFCFTAATFMLPAHDGSYSIWSLQPDLTKILLFIPRNLYGLAPVPVPKPAFWNTLAPVAAGVWVGVPISLIVLLSVWLALRDSPRHLGLFCIGFTGVWILTVVLFTLAKQVGYVRQFGSNMVLFIACVWLAAESGIANKVVTSRVSRTAIWLILAANLLAWGIASFYHLRYDFSGSREMANLIDRSGKATYPIVADIDYAASSVAGYLGRPLYYASNRKTQMFIRWDLKRIFSGQMNALIFANELSISNNSSVLLLLNYPLEFGQVRLLARTANTIVEDEVFYLYEYDFHNAVNYQAGNPIMNVCFNSQ